MEVWFTIPLIDVWNYFHLHNSTKSVLIWSGVWSSSYHSSPPWMFRGWKRWCIHKPSNKIVRYIFNPVCNGLDLVYRGIWTYWKSKYHIISIDRIIMFNACWLISANKCYDYAVMQWNLFDLNLKSKGNSKLSSWMGYSMMIWHSCQ